MGVTHARARVAALKRHRGPEDPETIKASRDLAAEHLADVITRIVDAAPPLTVEQRSRLSRILNAPQRDVA